MTLSFVRSGEGGGAGFGETVRLQDVNAQRMEIASDLRIKA